MMQYPELLTKLPVLERLSPRETPDLAIQTYEWFASNAKARNTALEAFLRGDSDVIPLQYTKLFDEDGIPIDLSSKHAALQDIMSDLWNENHDGSIPDDEVAWITFQTALYRDKEVEFVEVVQELNRPDATPEERIAAADKYRSLNEALYGNPDPETYAAIRGEIWSEIDSKQLHPNLQHLRDELANGFVTEHGVPVAALEWSDKRLPRMSAETMQWVKEQVYEQYGEYYDLVQQYWDEVIVPRHSRDEGPLEYSGEDFYILFQQALALLDPQGTSGISIDRVEDTGVLSWNTPTLSVRVGVAERKVTVDSPEKAFGKILHELVMWHGGRVLKGLQTAARVLGFGVYSEYDEGERPDYLTVEEGSAALTEAVVGGDITDKPEESQWKAGKLHLYANTALASLEQRSTREIFELTWRYSVLMEADDGQDLTPDAINKIKREVAMSFERYERSVSEDLPVEVGRIGFHKDLGYVNGRVIATKIFEDMARRNDVESFRNMQAVKIDPTNRRQRKLAADNGYPIVIGSDVISEAA